MAFNRSHNLEVKDVSNQDDLITIKKKSKKNRGKKRGRGNESQGIGRKSQRSSRPEIEPSSTTRYSNSNVFGTGTANKN